MFMHHTIYILCFIIADIVLGRIRMRDARARRARGGARAYACRLQERLAIMNMNLHLRAGTLTADIACLSCVQSDIIHERRCLA